MFNNITSYIFVSLCLSNRIGHLSVSSTMTRVTVGKKWDVSHRLKWMSGMSVLCGNG